MELLPACLSAQKSFILWLQKNFKAYNYQRSVTIASFRSFSECLNLNCMFVSRYSKGTFFKALSHKKDEYTYAVPAFLQ